ncbi:hypothetical protein BJF87_22595 [Gordonia sp. CNJ-863]|nr:hypothetical protein BJF87_22595 [Gordonia sp. CNJ-863]
MKLNEVVTEELGPGARTISISHHMAVISPPAHSADSLIKTLFKDTPIQPTVAQYQASITAVCESASA